MHNVLIHILFQIFICTKYINNLRLKKIFAPIEVKRKGIVRQSIKMEYDKEIRKTQETVSSTKDLEQFLIQPAQILRAYGYDYV